MMSKSTATQKLYNQAAKKTTTLKATRWLDVVEEKVDLTDTKKKVYTFVKHPGASVILPIDDKGHLVLVKQYRHAIEEIQLELPAGLIEKGEDPLASAKRELQEETGYYPHDIELMTQFYTAPGFSNELLYLFLAKKLEHKPLYDEDTDEIDVVTMSPHEALTAVKNGSIKDAKTMIGILLFFQNDNV